MLEFETSITEPITTEPITTEPITTEPITTELITTEPITTEPITTEPIIVVEQTFIELLKKTIHNENIKQTYNISLTPEVINIINNIISLNPTILTDIEKTLFDVIKDSTIDINDIPNFIVIIKQIYQVIYSSKNVKLDSNKRNNITSTILKYIIHLLVLERKIQIDENKQTEFLVKTDILIETCVDLLSYSKSLKPKYCLKKFFK